MKKTSFVLVLAMLLSVLSLNGLAVNPEHDHESCQTHQAAIDEYQTAIINVTDSTHELVWCEWCNDITAVWTCGREYYYADSGSHKYGLLGSKTCRITYFSSETHVHCYKCGFDKVWKTHPNCDEYHDACGLGMYACCLIDYY